MHRKQLIRLTALALLGAGCVGNVATVDAGGDLASASDGGGPMDFAVAVTDLASGYPAGPYGNTKGDTIPPLTWIGYQDDAGDVVATTRPYAPYSMDALRRSGRPYAIVHTAEFY